MSFSSRLWQILEDRGTPAMVGLDPRPDHFPSPFRERAREDPANTGRVFMDYHRALLEVIAARIGIVKIQSAFFERIGPGGMAALADAVEAAHDHGLLVLMDAKRGDIGSTAEAYAEAFFEGTGFPACDALTVNPYLGKDACLPFVESAREHDCGLFFLVKTSNPGAGLFQDHGDPPLSEKVAGMVAQWGESWHDDSGWSSIGAVIGATRPTELARFRELMPRAPLLLPGFGFQGGSAEGLEAAFREDGSGAVVSASRSILWAHEREDLAHLPSWEDRVDTALDEMIRALRPLRPSPR